MSVLFLLSNIAVPFLILSYISLMKLYQYCELSSVKWMFLIAFTAFSNILHYFFFEENKIFLLIDLAIKLIIVFLPTIITQTLEKIISAFHFQILISLFKQFWIEQFFILYCFVTSLTYKFLKDDSKLVFKRAVLSCFEKQQAKFSANSLKQYNKQFKIYDSIGINCDIINMGIINQQIRQKQLLKLQLAQRKVQSSISQMTNQSSDIKARESRLRTDVPINDNHTAFSMKKKTYTIQRSSTDLGQDQQITHQVKRIDKKINNISSQRRRQMKQDDEPSLILNKLDVSEYSDMFQDEEEDNNSKNIVGKVETIIQIGGVSSARLQIYNIQLFDSGQIRIVSLYGRQFQRHKLISMKALKHGYYELKLEGGKVASRKVKFRGPFEPFLKYIVE